MFVIIGFGIICGAMIAGFTMAGGKVGQLFHLSEIVSIFGMMIGCFILMAPVKVIKGIISQLLGTLKGAPYSSDDFEELLKCMYELFLLGRRGGMIALEEHVMNPEASTLFQKYPKFHGNHHAVEFLCDGLKPIVDGRIKPDQLPALMNSSLHTLEEEHHAPIHVLRGVGDSMPAFGIVAAVLGIVITMGKIGGDTEDGLFHLMEVECLGACVNAPMVQINDDFYEDLSAARMKEILAMLQRGEQPPVGSQTGRQTSAPATGATTLRDGGSA